jgi:hypothetical protein
MSEISSAAEDEASLDDALRRLGLLDSHASARWTPLTGGVSSLESMANRRSTI